MYQRRFSRHKPGNNQEGEKILLLLTPFWAPLNPPLGIACLKSHLKSSGYTIKLEDANLSSDLWSFHRFYFQALEPMIPEAKRGNFHLVGYDVFMNHLMAHIHQEQPRAYHDLIKLLVRSSFFVDIDDQQVVVLSDIIRDFYNLFEKYLQVLMEKENPQVVGITVYSVTLASSMFAFKWIKEHYPLVRTLMGGGIFADQLAPDSPNFPVFLKKAPFIDKIFVGEGELLFQKYLAGELPEAQRVYTIKDINHQFLDLNNTRIPDFSGLDVSGYPQLSGFASRSCPFQCSFCSETVQWGKYRRKEASQVADELIALSRKYKRSVFMLGDSLVNPIASDLSRELVDRDVMIYWDGYLRADPPAAIPENVQLWRKGGYYRARLGIESGSGNVLKAMDKKTNPEQIKAVISMLAEAGIKTTTYWVIGHPGETEEDFLQTLALVEACHKDIYEADFHPFYFSPNGQVNSQKWREENRVISLYPEETQDMLITQTWVLDTYPSRLEIYSRIARFEDHLKKYNIPNPYSLKDIYFADMRWQKLHRNAVPALGDIQ